MTQEQPELLPCPLCGGEAVWCGDHPRDGEPHDCDQITCHACGYNIDFDDAEVRVCEDFAAARAIVAQRWNRRAEVQRLSAASAPAPQPEKQPSSGKCIMGYVAFCPHDGDKKCVCWSEEASAPAPQPSPTLNKEKERREFESWAKKEGYSLNRYDGMAYEDPITFAAWNGWLARANTKI